MAERIYNASKNFEPDIVVRVLLRRFYIDMDLINSLILKLQEGYDYINLDNNIYSEVAADVCTFPALQHVVELIKELPNDYKSNSFRFNPWRFMEVNSNFKILKFSYEKPIPKSLSISLEVLLIKFFPTKKGSLSGRLF